MDETTAREMPAGDVIVTGTHVYAGRTELTPGNYRTPGGDILRVEPSTRQDDAEYSTSCP